MTKAFRTDFHRDDSLELKNSLTFLIPNCSASVFSGPRNPAAIITRSALNTFSVLGISSIVHLPVASCNLRLHLGLESHFYFIFLLYFFTSFLLHGNVARCSERIRARIKPVQPLQSAENVLPVQSAAKHAACIKRGKTSNHQPAQLERAGNEQLPTSAKRGNGATGTKRWKTSKPGLQFELEYISKIDV